MKIKNKFYSDQDIVDIDHISKDFWLERFRNWRLLELSKTDWTQLPDAPVDKIAFAEYRQTLRDLPKIADFANAELPNAPK